MQVVLVMFTAAGERRSFSLSKDLTTIGRRENADLRIPLGDVSRKHCRLTLRGNQLHLNDLGSSNGTLVNGARVDSADLHPGDVLKVGPVQFVVQIDGQPADDAITPPSAASADTGDFDLMPDAPAPEDSFAAVLEGLPAGSAKSPAADDDDWDIINEDHPAPDSEGDAPNR